jgi:hypothetical protein
MSKQSVVIVSPDGGMQYCTEIDNNNPYSKKEKISQTIQQEDEENMYRYRELLQLDNSYIILTNQEITNARKLEKYNFCVRLVCLLDIFTNTIYVFSPDIIINFLFMCISFLGYISTYTYNRQGFRLYLIYKYSISIYSLIISIYINVLILDNKYNKYNKYNIYFISNDTSYRNDLVYINNNNYKYIMSIYYIIIPILQLLICNFLQNYYNLFPKYIIINNI